LSRARLASESGARRVGAPWRGLAGVTVATALVVVTLLLRGSPAGETWWLSRPAVGRVMMALAALLALAAPWWSIASSGPSRSWGGLAPYLSVVACAGTSLATLLVATLLSSGSPGASVTGGEVLEASLLLLFAGLGFATLGTLLSILAKSPLAAAGLAALLSLLAICSPVVLTPALADGGGTTSLIEASLLVSPVVGLATASGLDPMRSELLYRASPIGQRRFAYPSTSAASMFFAAAAIILSLTSVGISVLRKRAFQRRRYDP
jgi:hypothetical protein